MNEWDQMIARQVEQDGVRMASGQHIAAHPSITRQVPHGWERCDACGAAWDPCVRGHHCRGRHGAWVNHAELRAKQDPDVTADPWVDRRDHYDR